MAFNALSDSHQANDLWASTQVTVFKILNCTRDDNRYKQDKNPRVGNVVGLSKMKSDKRGREGPKEVGTPDQSRKQCSQKASGFEDFTLSPARNLL